MRLRLLLFLVMTSVLGSAAQDLERVFHLEKLAAMDAAVESAIVDGRCPGGVLWLERAGVVYQKAYGKRAVEPAAETMTLDTIFDAASLTKVLATAPAVMRLVEQGRVELDAPASRYLAEFGGEGKEQVTVRQLLTHTSGLPAGFSPVPVGKRADEVFALICAGPLPDGPGKVFRYSDLGFIVLGELVHRVSGQGLDKFCAREFFGPLKMRETVFRPGAKSRPRIAPTTKVDGAWLRGTVHDPTARTMGGVAGHAGLFTTAHDLARFARMLLRGGELDGVRVLKAETVALMTSVQTPSWMGARRGLGWDIDSTYSGLRGRWFPIGGFGHTGWTGGSLWVDPFSQTIVIFLSNRNHPADTGNVLELRKTLGTLGAEAVRGFDFLNK